MPKIWLAAENFVEIEKTSPPIIFFAEFFSDKVFCNYFWGVLGYLYKINVVNKNGLDLDLICPLSTP